MNIHKIKTFLTLGLLMSLLGCISVHKTVEFDHSLDFVELDGYKFHVKTFGDKNNLPVIVVHGGPGGDSNYLYGLSELSKSYYVIFYDQRGTGLSPRMPKENLNLESSLNDLNLFVEHYRKGKKIKLIGHSWGAMLVIGYLSRFGDRVSHAVAVEPGILNSKSATEFATLIKKNQSVWEFFSLVGTILKTPFVRSLDGYERFDYVMTKMMNRNKPGGPYQCKNESMPENSFVRAGYDSFANMLKPVLNNPKFFTSDLTNGISNYKGELLMISSECSFIGYDYQKKFHIPLLPISTIHLKAMSMGHNMLTLNSAWSINLLNNFFRY
jgi:proline iminopeptidase